MADKNESGNAQTPEPNTSSDVSVTPSDAPETASPPQTKGKRKLPRTTLSLREKAIVKSFCEQKVTDSKARGELVPSQELLRREVAAQFGFNCGRSTLSKIMSMDWRLLRGGHEGGDAPRNTNMKRRRRPRFPDFEADLLQDPEHPREDYGQTAVFHGGDMEKEVMDVENTALSYQLDDEFSFQKGECVAIDSNTAQILSTSWLRSFFSPVPSQTSESATSESGRIEMVDIYQISPKAPSFQVVSRMSHILHAVSTGSQASLVPIKRALLSVSDKTGVVELATYLSQHGVELLSTGGTAKALRDAKLPVVDVSTYTGSPEIMDGRVKTLHPKIHGGLLGVRGNAQHEADMAANGIQNIDLVVLNLYAFEAAVANGGNFDTCIENIDIGGPSMLRSSAKNHKAVVICSSPTQYPRLMQELDTNQASFSTSLEFRRSCAAAAFSLAASYDSAISSWLNGQLGNAAPTVTRVYKHEFGLKYGCNPHQNPAAILSRVGSKLPFTVLNGTPGYINLLDAANAYQLVRELRLSLGLPAAASFKHVSPAGAAVAVDLVDGLHAAYEVGNVTLTPLSLAYLRARNADPLSSFGDFVAVSDVVDEATAKILKREVSDGIIAPGYEPAAFEILKAKKGGKFIVLEADANFTLPDMEFREVAGITFSQKRNDVLFSAEKHLADVQTSGAGPLTDAKKRDLALAAITLKYTQSNSVGYAKDGQMIGVGAGQQSRVDCVKLAGRKVAIWHLRQHPKVQGLVFKSGVKRQERVNARVRYIEGDMAPAELKTFNVLFETVPEPFTVEEKDAFLKTLTDVSLASDAFFPFRDSIDHATKLGVKFITQPGGSTRDADVKSACDEFGITMAFSNLRLFHH
ncbi:hypothetical protein BBO99_00007638 [Phytophthora kernoviae]|uniref:MGS-like domain-containing protein n=1 Tax=Phytophthora kernoviae TaxID=325452 RepID=A0A3R7JQN7_9STRA|nr:hypothetical protein BBO99_00007638 [Phytophthora kernoviae]